MNHIRILVAASLVLMSSGAAAQTSADRFQIAAAWVGAASGEFDSTDAGVAVRLTWKPVPLVGVEAETSFYLGDFADTPAFSGGRIEALFGATVGPVIGRVRPFGKLRPGFVRFREASEPFACVAVFPPPLQCRLGSGETVLALDLGGGVEFFPTGRTLLRVDLGDRLMRYPGPVRGHGFQAHDGPFFSHDVRFALGGGVRF